MNTSTSLPTLFLALRCRDADAQIAFLTDGLGFRLAARYADDDGAVAHAQLNRPDGRGGVMLGQERPDGDECSPAPGAAGCYLVAQDVSAMFERAVAAGAQVVRPPSEMDYGSMEFTIRDPEGNLWSVGTYAGEE